MRSRHRRPDAASGQRVVEPVQPGREVVGAREVRAGHGGDLGGDLDAADHERSEKEIRVRYAKVKAEYDQQKVAYEAEYA